MRKKYIFGKKLYISVLTSILVLLTTIATTFAWVGVFANSTFESFDVMLKASNLDEYGIEVSLTGEEGSFSDSIDQTELKRQILLNWGFPVNILSSKKDVEAYFNSLKMDQCTTLPIVAENKLVSLGTFYDMYGIKTKHLFQFDIYISATKFYDSGDLSNYMLDVYLNEDAMVGRTKNRSLFNSFTFPSSFVNPYIDLVSNNLLKLPDGIVPLSGGDRIVTATLDSSSASRIAFEKYKVVNKYDTNAYSEWDTPISTLIYQNGYEYPVYDTINDIYNFGSILPDEINLATAYFNSSESKYLSDNFKTISIPSDMYNIRGVDSITKDIVLSKTTNNLIDSNNPNEQITVNHMMKVKISFWFEGWDADCFKAIAGSPVDLVIKLSTTNEDE